MATLTSVDLGATGRYIELDGAALDNVGSKTIMALVRPDTLGDSNFGYLKGKTPTGSINGERLFPSSGVGWTYAFHSTGTAGSPTRATANSSFVVDSWQCVACSHDGSLTAANIHIYYAVADVGGDIGDLAEETSYSATTNGTTAFYDDSAHPTFLMNRFGLGRAFVGDYAWFAEWDRVLNLTEINQAKADGPLSVPTGLIYVYANGQIYDPNASGVTIVDRSTRVEGTLPNNLNLGGDTTLTADSGSYTVTGTAATLTYASPNTTLTADSGSFAVTGTAATLTYGEAAPVIEGGFEECSVDLAGSSVSGVGSAATITIKPAQQETEAVSGTTRKRWLNPYFRVASVLNKRPTFELLDYAATAADGKYHGAPWQAGRRMVFSYDPDDPDAWVHFDTAHTVGASTIEFRHSTAFTQSPVYVAWSPRFSVTQFGQRLEDLATAFPTMVLPTDASLATVPSEISGFPAQSFIVGMYTAQTDDLSNAIPETPLYAWWINDPALTPATGSKRTMALTMGNHGGEPLGDLNAFEGIEFLCSSDTQAQNVRQHAQALCLGPINAPGRYGGGWRGSFTQGPGGIDDANRNFTGASANSGLEIVDKPMQVLLDVLPPVVQVAIDHHGAYSTKFGIYTDVASHDAFLAALDPYVTASISDKGTSAIGDVEQWFADNYNSTFYVTYESGEPTPMTTGERTEWSQAFVKAVSDLITSGAIPATFSLIAASGSFSVTGTAAALTYGSASVLTADSGSFAISGTAATLKYGAATVLTAASGSFTVSGTAATFVRDYVFTAASGSFVITGVAATLTKSSGIWTPIDAANDSWASVAEVTGTSWT
jgi:hypothetical protein